MTLIERLTSFATFIDNSKPGNKVDQMLVTGGVNLIIFDGLLLLEQVLVVSSKYSWQDEVKLLLSLLSKIE